MATIQDRIDLADGVSPALKRMVQAAEMAAARFEMAGQAAGRISRAADFAAAAVDLSDVGNAASVAVASINEIHVGASMIPPPIYSAAGAAGSMNSELRQSTGILGGIRSALSSTFAQFTLANMAANYLQQFISMLANAPGKLAAMSDQYSGIIARLNLVTGSQEQTAALNDQIYYSALRARGGYAEMADAVSKIAMTAKEAFPNPKQVVPFMEGIQKLFAIGGTDVVRQKDALLQLTQALGSGKLQGDEFRSIAEAAPMIEQMVAQYMGVSQGALKALSSEGAITAEIMKNAILGSLDEIDAKFNTIPMKWQDIWQNAETVAYRAFVPVFEQLSALANSDAAKSLGNSFGVGARVAGQAVAGLINNVRWLGGVAQSVGGYVGTWLSAGFTILAPVFEILTALALSFFMVYAFGWIAAQAPLAAHIALMGIKATWDAILIAYAWAQNAAMVVQNAELLVMYTRLGAITAATALWTLVTQGVTAALRILNLTMLMNPIGIVVALVALIIIAFGAWAIKTQGLRNTIADAFEGIVGICQAGVNIMIKSINNLMGIINKASEGLNSLFGTNIGKVDVIGEVDFQGFQKKWGGAIRDGTVIEEIKKEYGDLFKMPEMSGTPDYSTVPPLESIAESGKGTKENTGAMKDAMEITDEDIKYLRDIAEQEVINKYTTAEIKIDMGGVQQNISNGMDLDGVLNHMISELQDGMASGAEAVHK